MLVRHARHTLEHHLTGAPYDAERPDVPAFAEKRGAFVTLTKNNRLRGCIGHVETDRPLWETISLVAVAAAQHDPRFPAVDASELDQIKLELSILTLPEPLPNPDQLEVGRHGLIIDNGTARGLLLPQVASERGWDAETFLRQVSLKAGLHEDAWQLPDVRLFVFSAEVFGEEDSPVRD